MPLRITTRFTRTWLGALVLAALVACTSSPNPANPMDPTDPGGGGGGGGGGNPPAGAGTLTFFIDGVPWVSLVVLAENNTQTGGFAISSVDPSQRNFGFAIRNTGIGAYPVGVDSTTNAALNDVTNNSSWWATGTGGGSGTVVVTNWTPSTAAGTFMFTLVRVPGTDATGEKMITNGVFNVNYTTTSDDGR